jgi:hypothetical protein
MRLPSARVAPMSRVSSVLASLSLANTCLNSRITHTAPKTAFKFSLELFKNGFGKRDLSPSDLGSSKYPDCLHYRFSWVLPADLAYAYPPRQQASSAYSRPPRRGFPHLFSCRITDSLGGHTDGVAHRHCRDLLLPLSRIAAPPRLREDV